MGPEIGRSSPFISAIICLFIIGCNGRDGPLEYSECQDGPGDFFQFRTGALEPKEGEEIVSFDKYKGRVIFAINVASF